MESTDSSVPSTPSPLSRRIQSLNNKAGLISPVTSMKSLEVSPVVNAPTTSVPRMSVSATSRDLPKTIEVFEIDSTLQILEAKNRAIKEAEDNLEVEKRLRADSEYNSYSTVEHNKELRQLWVASKKQAKNTAHRHDCQVNELKSEMRKLKDDVAVLHKEKESSETARLNDQIIYYDAIAERQEAKAKCAAAIEKLEALKETQKETTKGLADSHAAIMKQLDGSKKEMSTKEQKYKKLEEENIKLREEIQKRDKELEAVQTAILRCERVEKALAEHQQYFSHFLQEGLKKFTASMGIADSGAELVATELQHGGRSLKRHRVENEDRPLNHQIKGLAAQINRQNGGGVNEISQTTVRDHTLDTPPDSSKLSNPRWDNGSDSPDHNWEGEVGVGQDMSRDRSGSENRYSGGLRENLKRKTSTRGRGRKREGKGSFKSGGFNSV